MNCTVAKSGLAIVLLLAGHLCAQVPATGGRPAAQLENPSGQSGGSGPSTPILVAIAKPSPSNSNDSSETDYGCSLGMQNRGIEAFVQGVYVRGIPVAALEPFRKNDFEKKEASCVLMALLRDPARAKYWETAVITLGLLGYSPSAKFLNEFASSDPKVGPTITPAIYRSKLRAFVSLGYLLHFSVGAERVEISKYLLDYRDKLRSSTPMNRIVSWSSPYSDSYSALLVEISSSLIQGMGLSADARMKSELALALEGHRRALANANTEEVKYHSKSGVVVSRRQLEKLIAATESALKMSDDVLDAPGLIAYYTK